MNTRLPLTSQLALLTSSEVLAVAALILSVLTLSAGTSPNSLRQYAILTLDTSSISSTLTSNPTTSANIPDWYEVHYLSICSGTWNKHLASAGKNGSSVICVSQSVGYTFSLARILGSESAVQHLNLSSHDTLDTQAPVALLAIGIACIGLSLLLLPFGVVTALLTNAHYTATAERISLTTLRVAYVAIIAATILLTISSAKITAFAAKVVGTVEVGKGVAVRAWMGKGFYVFVWLGTASMWVAMGLVVAVAFRIAREMQNNNKLKVKSLES